MGPDYTMIFPQSLAEFHGNGGAEGNHILRVSDWF